MGSEVDQDSRNILPTYEWMHEARFRAWYMDDLKMTFEYTRDTWEWLEHFSRPENKREREVQRSAKAGPPDRISLHEILVKVQEGRVGMMVQYQ